MIKLVVIITFIVVFVLALVVIGSATSKYKTGWYQDEPFHFEYLVDGRPIATVYAGDNATWVWIVRIKTSLDPIQMGAECCMEEAFEQVNRILMGSYYM